MAANHPSVVISRQCELESDWESLSPVFLTTTVTANKHKTHFSSVVSEEWDEDLELELFVKPSFNATLADVTF